MFWAHRSFWILPIIVAAILGGLSALVSHTRLREVYERRLAESPRERLFLASLSFFITVLVVRGLTIAIRHDIGPFHNISMNGRHIHHLVWGILLLLLVGYLWLIEVGTGAASSTQWTGRLMSMLFGVAAALTLVEFALWLNLRDVYWEREGRESFEALALFGGLLAIGIFGRAFWSGIARELGSILHGRRNSGSPDRRSA
jgi:energy-converting hydrogenase Eha subunit A